MTDREKNCTFLFCTFLKLYDPLFRNLKSPHKSGVRNFFYDVIMQNFRSNPYSRKIPHFLIASNYLINRIFELYSICSRKKWYHLSKSDQQNTYKYPFKMQESCNKLLNQHFCSWIRNLKGFFNWVLPIRFWQIIQFFRLQIEESSNIRFIK